MEIAPVKNYYQLDLFELDRSIYQIRRWLFIFLNSGEIENIAGAFFALNVACCAKDIYATRKEDPWVQMVLDTVCP